MNADLWVSLFYIMHKLCYVKAKEFLIILFESKVKVFG